MNKPTPQAMAAAAALFPMVPALYPSPAGQNVALTREAEIIDEASGLPELLAVAEAARNLTADNGGRALDDALARLAEVQGGAK